MSKKAYFYIDDVVWPFRDITREKPASIFDQTLLKMLKEAHDKYGYKYIFVEDLINFEHCIILTKKPAELSCGFNILVK